ncbi:MAG: galactose-phosphate uridyl transferase [Thermoleophilia bacterium]|nr:galactose-phosphate uridyl transferase [Thermoleophilia bacterium]
MLREDPITGDVRLLAPGRASDLRPATRGCPFCPGHEADTPATTGSRPPREGGSGGEWGARSFDNRFPLTDPHEIVVPSCRHVTAWRELTLPELEDGLALLLERRRALLEQDRYVHAFVNDGAGAGASLSHVHAQLVVMERTAHTDRLVDRVRDEADCALCRLLDDDDLVVERGLHHTIVAHPLPRLAGGLIVAPSHHHAEPGDANLAEFAGFVHRALAAVDEGTAANLWLVADEARGAHWYLEVQPRGANLAGVELALGVLVSAADPRDTAVEARERLAMRR